LQSVIADDTGHGNDAPLSENATVAAISSDVASFGFCYEACKSERAIGSCGTGASGHSHAPREMCRPIQFDATLSAIIGPPLGTGASPFVDDNKSTDPAQQPAGYTFLGQFIDHDVTRTQTALLAMNTLSLRAQRDAGVRAKLAAAGVSSDQLKQAIANAIAPSSALSINTGKLDLDSVYGVADFSALTGISAPWFEQSSGTYTGRFAMRHVQAPAALAAPIDGFDYQRTPDGTPEVPDPRNSEHKLISQIQNLFELAHNACMDKRRSAISPRPTNNKSARLSTLVTKRWRGRMRRLSPPIFCHGFPPKRLSDVLPVARCMHISAGPCQLPCCRGRTRSRHSSTAASPDKSGSPTSLQ
jgi:hypothetical protein